MKNKIKILATQFFYPVTVGRYVIEALQEREDVEIKTAGPAFGSWIPWNGGMNLPAKYAFEPDISFPNTNTIPVGMVEARLGDWKPDVILQLDAGFHLTGRPKHGYNMLFETDPHCLKDWYRRVAKDFDFIWCTQTPYMDDGDHYIRYAYSSKWFYPEQQIEIYDVCMIGLPYNQRQHVIRALEEAGIKVFTGLGIVFDEYRKVYNQSRIALSWSSLQDTPMRVYEGMGMNLPLVANRTPDLVRDFKDGQDFFGFDTASEAVEKVKYVLAKQDDAERVAVNGFLTTKFDFTWQERAHEMVEEMKRRI